MRERSSEWTSEVPIGSLKLRLDNWSSRLALAAMLHQHMLRRGPLANVLGKYDSRRILNEEMSAYPKVIMNTQRCIMIRLQCGKIARVVENTCGHLRLYM